METVKDIYKRVLIERQKILEPPPNPTQDTYNRLRMILGNSVTSMQTTMSKQDHDNLMRDVSNTLDFVVMNTDPDVIKVLTNKSIIQQYKSKNCVITIKNIRNATNLEIRDAAIHYISRPLITMESGVFVVGWRLKSF